MIGRLTTRWRAIGYRKKSVIICSLIYGILWALTATWGVADIDSAFDREFTTGHEGLGTTKVTPIRRIAAIPNIRDLADPANAKTLDGLFRYRSHGIAIAPFLVIDEAAVIYASLGGFGGKRLTFWFFGWTTWVPLQRYWAV